MCKALWKFRVAKKQLFYHKGTNLEGTKELSSLNSSLDEVGTERRGQEKQCAVSQKHCFPLAHSK
jgi:hypothetical protein